MKQNCNCSSICYLCKSGKHPHYSGPIGFKAPEQTSGPLPQSMTVDEANKWMKDNGMNVVISGNPPASSGSEQADKSNPLRESTETMGSNH